MAKGARSVSFRDKWRIRWFDHEGNGPRYLPHAFKRGSHEGVELRFALFSAQ